MLKAIVTFIQKLAADPIVERSFKTFVEATAAQAALYTTVVPSSPGVKGTAAVSVGATVLSVLWNLIEKKVSK
jgi:hypothetical protein